MKKRLTLTLFTLALLLGFTIQSQATKYAPPAPKNIVSENGKFTLVTSPKTEEHKVYASSDLKKPLWSFKLEMWHFPVYLSNDGKTACHISWRHVKEDKLKNPAIVFRNAKGIVKSYSLEKLFPNPPRTQDVGKGPIGNFWRTWYTKSDSSSDKVRIHTTDKRILTFSINDGALLSDEKD